MKMLTKEEIRLLTGIHKKYLSSRTVINCNQVKLLDSELREIMGFKRNSIDRCRKILSKIRSKKSFEVRSIRYDLRGYFEYIVRDNANWIDSFQTEESTSKEGTLTVNISPEVFDMITLQTEVIFPPVYQTN